MSKLKRWYKKNKMDLSLKWKYLIYGDKKADKILTKEKCHTILHRELDIDNPKTMNEKIQWLKLNVHEDFHTVCADKLKVRDYWKQFGEDGLIPLLYKTYDWRDITPEVIPDEPCVIKCNNGSGAFKIIHSKENLDYEKLRRLCKDWLKINYYHRTQEWQYKNVKSCIIIEKLLLDKNGHIPNDYKLHYINGKLAFIYCSIDREGKNYRSIYDPEWNLIPMEWVAPRDHKGIVGELIPAPESLSRMIEIGNEVSKKFAYVRVDFYDLEGKLYYGEITLHHGGGFDTFVPEKYDLEYGEKLDISYLQSEK